MSKLDRKWIVPAALAMAFATPAAAQQAGAPRGIRLEFPDGVDLTEMQAIYDLYGAFGRWGDFVNTKPGVRSYDLMATGKRFQAAGQPANALRAMIYVPGYRFVLLADSGFGDGPLKTVRVPLEPLGSVALNGKVSGIADTKNLSVEISYMAPWGMGFFGYGLSGAVPQFKIAPTPLRADGSFTVMVPDFARDPVVWRPDTLRPGTFASAYAQQDTLSRGAFSISVVDTRTDETRNDLVTTITDGVDWDIAVAPSYPSPIALLAMATLDYPAYLPKAVRSLVGKRFTYNCRPKVASGKTGTLYGVDVYSEDSDVCAAAVHAGIFSSAGQVTIEIRPGQSSYAASTRNGVTSATKTGGSSHSFVFVR